MLLTQTSTLDVQHLKGTNHASLCDLGGGCGRLASEGPGVGAVPDGGAGELAAELQCAVPALDAVLAAQHAVT
jgi:hypothetical protein